MRRCSWCNINNKLYVDYHDNEWGMPKYDDKELYELLILEMFQAGLSWETILNKRENFRKAFSNFNIDEIINYSDEKIKELEEDKGIIRNRRKIKATINNSKIFKKIQSEYGSFSDFIWSFTNNQVIYNKEKGIAHSKLSDTISKELKRKGMTFVGTVIIYSYLQAIGVVNDHDNNCLKNENNL